MSDYQADKIERKWQDVWDRLGLYRAEDFSEKPKEYILVEFPYPSGSGLHVGHCRSYMGMDVIARKKRMEGKNVLFPMGWDAFGLPTENYAIKTGIHPKIATQKNTANFKRQQKMLGFSFDWSREINTSDPHYFKWTQWIFIKLFEAGLAYKDKMDINWCPNCRIGLANEEVVNGACERCGGKVVRKEKEQWLLKITDYADRLLEDIEKVDYPERVKTLEREWIGKSIGAEITFSIRAGRLEKPIKVFTTRPDTIFGVTYLAVAPEHQLIKAFKDHISNLNEVEAYIKKARSKTELERISEMKHCTGVKLEGVTAINPATQEDIPVFTADYVLSHYGTGIIMAVPAHDKRDHRFAKQFGLPIIEVIKPQDRTEVEEEAYTGEGKMINSGPLNSMSSSEARKKIIEMLKNKGLAEESVHYRLRDWIFSRQRYWGEPIPMVQCPKCGWVPVPEKDLPIELPAVEKYEPTENGDSPLAKVKSWVKTRCPKCGGPAKRETDVMPNWAGSNWYFLRYCDPHNQQRLASPDKLKYWMGVDWYNGGMEHATAHLLYSRFIYKFLLDIKAIPQSLGIEPYKKRTCQGLVLAQGGVKMSKSKGNVINPDEIVGEFGADTLRTYEMFIGPFSQDVVWDVSGVKGVFRFLEKVWKLSSRVSKKGVDKSDESMEKLVHQTIKKVTEDIDMMKFNTAVSSLMILVNEMEKREWISKEHFRTMLLLLSPFAPHIAEELWGKLVNRKNPEEYKREDSIFSQAWPRFDQKVVEKGEITLVVQVNGKLRGRIMASRGLSRQEAEKLAKEQEKIKKYLQGRKIKRVVFMPDKLINFVI